MPVWREGFKMKKRVQLTDEDWLNLEHEVIQSFTPGTPINEAELLAGRTDTLRQLQNAVLEPGRHALIYGERGVGKTSIANTFHRSLNRPTREVVAIRVNGDASDTFESLWRKVFRRIKKVADDGTESWADQAHEVDLTEDDVIAELSSFPPQYCPIIILDEFDRIKDEKCKTLMADIVKNLSDYSVNCTLIIVGVAKSVNELINNLPSVSRALLQVPMPRLSRRELEDIVVLRLRRLGMKIDDLGLWRLTFISAGLPFYTHSLGKHSAIRAIRSHRIHISEDDVYKSMQDCLSDVDYTVKESYLRATEKIYRKANIFAKVLAGCALTEMDALGQFSAVSVEKPLSEVMGEQVTTESFGFHLNELSRPARGSILEKTGERRTFKFQFVNPMMQPYIVMRSLQQGIITPEMIARRSLKPQMELSIEPQQLS
jgi:Cdc6-like AAA superfamily ATPase